MTTETYLKQSQSAEERIIAILGEQESELKTAEIRRKHQINLKKFYNCRTKYGGLDVLDA